MRRAHASARWRSLPLAALALAAWASCGDPAGVYDDEPNEFDLIRDTGTPIQTDRLEYRLEESAEGLFTRIAIEWTNPTDRTVYVANCPVEDDPQYRVDLLREAGAGFQPALESEELDCAGAPLEILAGETFVDTLDLVASRPGGPPPAFLIDPIRGVYRMVIRSAFHTYDVEHDVLADSLPTLARVSNRFGLITPD